MATYILLVQATWRHGCEAPWGKEDHYKDKEADLKKEFRAKSDVEAQAKVPSLLKEFEESLGLTKGSLSWDQDFKMGTPILCKKISL